MAVVAAHVAIARRLGPAGHARAAIDPPRWPQQTIRNAIVMAIAVAALLAVVNQYGADLAAPADPSAAYDARPLWYFRWLFELRQLAGSWEKLAAMTAPAVVGGFFVALPLLDPGGTRRLWRGAGCGVLAVVVALTAASLVADYSDDQLADRQTKDDARGALARDLAVRYGVPVTGGLDVFTTPPMWRARALFAQRCQSCHGRGEKDRKGPIIEPGHGNRAWLAGFITTPSGDAYWGHTKLAATDDAMKPVVLSQRELSDVVEAMYAESGATDVDAKARDRGKAIYDKACNDCHSLDAFSSGTSAPSLGGLGSRDYYASFIANPKASTHMNGAERSQMPRFDAELSLVDRDAVAAYLVWLRDATPAQLHALGPL
jgi:ubiquinol-cytochrome c reductase cytochrome b subunit